MIGMSIRRRSKRKVEEGYLNPRFGLVRTISFDSLNLICTNARMPNNKNATRMTMTIIAGVVMVLQYAIESAPATCVARLSLRDPSGHSKHFVWLTLLLYNPMGQSMHPSHADVVLPAGPYDPAGQCDFQPVLQLEQVVAPVSEVYLPALQALHVAALNPPTTKENLPAGQDRHLPPSHADVVLLTGPYDPAAHFDVQPAVHCEHEPEGAVDASL